MRTVWVFGLLWLSLGGRTIGAEDWETVQQQFYAGQYQQCIEGVRAAIKDGTDSYRWPVLLVQSLLATGQYDQAYEEASSFVNDTFPLSMPLLMVAHEAYQDTNHGPQAHMLLERIYRMAAVRRIDYLDAQELVAVGRAVLLLGGEPRIILEEFYNRAQRKDPNDVTAFIAAGELALDKQDYELAAQQYQTALKRFADVPAVHVGLAQAFYPSDRQAMLQALNAALVINPQQCDALLLLAEHEIDAENYAHAQDLLDQVLHVNPWRPEAWALKAVLATLGYGREDASVCRKKAMTYWPANPAVDSLIGRKLAQKYRFSEAADFQRKALNLAFDQKAIALQRTGQLGTYPFIETTGRYYGVLMRGSKVSRAAIE